MYNMLKMKKMNGLKIFALVLLSLSKFETMFGMKENEEEKNINDEYVNKNYYLIDAWGYKITLDKDEDIKFKINKEEIELEEFNMNEKILKIKENGVEKILVCEEKKEKCPVLYENNAVNVWAKQNECKIIKLKPQEKNQYNTNIIQCSIVKKIGEDSINDDYILVDAENNKIEKIEDKNIVFKLLTRKKGLELKKNLNGQDKILKNDEGKYILDNTQKPFFFEKEDNNLILYVRRSENNLWLANWLLFGTNINFNKDNSIEVRMAKKKEIPIVKEEEILIVKKEEIPKVEEKEEKEDSSKCCYGIC